MAEKLIFSIDRDLYVKKLVYNSSVKFEMGFKTRKFFVNWGGIINLIAEGDKGIPLVEIVVRAGIDSPIPKIEVVITPAPTVSSKEDNGQKSIVDIEVKSVFEKGSSFETPLTSKNARKNYLGRIRNKITKTKKIGEIKALSLVELQAAKEMPIPASSPLLKGSHFYPLAAIAREERVSRIASSTLCPVDYSVRKASKEKQVLRTRILRNIIHTYTAQVGEIKE